MPDKPDDPWVKYKWTTKDLEGKTVTFPRTIGGFNYPLVGTFQTLKHPDGRKKLRILFDAQVAVGKFQRTLFRLNQAQADSVALAQSPVTTAYVLSVPVTG